MVDSEEVSLQSVLDDGQGFCCPVCSGKLIPPPGGQNRQGDVTLKFTHMSGVWGRGGGDVQR